jgi:acid phosphatase class B
MNKFDGWYDSLSPNTKDYLKNQAIWRDKDLFKFSAIAFAIGVIVGAIL